MARSTLKSSLAFCGPFGVAAIAVRVKRSFINMLIGIAELEAAYVAYKSRNLSLIELIRHSGLR